MKALWIAVLVATMSGCSVRQLALNSVSDVVAGGGSTYSADDDLDLIRAAAPFSLKLIESLLSENPRHKGLLVAAAKGFTQYAYAFVQQEAEELEERDLGQAAALEERARGLYRRARDYGLRALELDSSDVPALYWTAVSWAALIALSKTRPEAIGELPAMEALIDRALELDEGFERGALHSFLVVYEPVRQGASGDPHERSRRHFARAVALSGGNDAAPFVALAEAVCVPQQQRGEFEALLQRALSVEGAQENRLANRVAQRRARWLLTRTERLFTN
jgi:predicted anti-sigma-YlaC factor YlaD